MTEDLAADVLARTVSGRELRSYPALLSTESEALAWARSGAPEGAIVVADYQASPRGRAGLPWQIRPQQGLGFSMVLRPDLPPHREGWLYTVASLGLATALGGDTRIEWPDQIVRNGEAVGAVAVQAAVELFHLEWAVASVMVPEAPPPRGALLVEVVGAIERWYRAEVEQVLACYRPRLETLGKSVRALLIPMGPAGPQVGGRAVDVGEDGALVLETEAGRRVPVLPQHLGRLET